MTSKIVSALFCGFFLALPARAGTLIQQALEAGVLDLETALLYQVYAVRDPQALPEEYRPTLGHAFCGTPLVSAVYNARMQLSGPQQKRLAKALARPVLPQRHMSPSGRFQIHYTLEGRGQVDTTDQDDNGIPDYIDAVTGVLDSTWTLQVDSLGYRPPPSDRGLGGGNQYDVYIVDLGPQRVYGLAWPENMSGFSSHSYLELDNNYTDTAYERTRGLDALRVSIAHEFFHAIHFAYYTGNDSNWWREATSTWMEEVAYPEVDDYLQYVSYFLSAPGLPLDADSGERIYGASLFAHFLDQRYQRDLIRAIWEEVSQRRSGDMGHFDHAILQATQDRLGEAVSEFAVWNYFTGERHRKGWFYREGEKYHQVHVTPLDTPPRSTVLDSGRVGHLASAYIRLDPQLHSGGVVLETDLPRGRWSRQLLLVSPDSLEVRPMRRNPERIYRWDEYDEIVLVLVNEDLGGVGYQYLVAVEYDPDLTDRELPLTFRLRQSFPNPFRPSVHQTTALPFDLSVPSLSTRLSIFAVDGRLVRSYDLGRLRAASHTRFSWDGRNAKGELVGSGLYYYVLEADQHRAQGTLAVVR